MTNVDKMKLIRLGNFKAEYLDAIDEAIAAIERQNKEPCERCKGNEQIWTYKDSDNEFMHYRADFCPHCSRDLRKLEG